MIADVLFDAANRIDQYLDEQPQVLADVREEILTVVEVMRALQEKLDALGPEA